MGVESWIVTSQLISREQFHNDAIEDSLAYGRLTGKKRTKIIRESVFFSLHKMHSMHLKRPSLHIWDYPTYESETDATKWCVKLNHQDEKFLPTSSNNWTTVITSPSNQLSRTHINFKLLQAHMQKELKGAKIYR